MRPATTAPLPPSPDWSLAALARTWRTFSILCWSTGLILAWLHPLPGIAFGLLGWWAQSKAHGKALPQAGALPPWPPRRVQRVVDEG